jgi:hypothetical protein
MYVCVYGSLRIDVFLAAELACAPGTRVDVDCLERVLLRAVDATRSVYICVSTLCFVGRLACCTALARPSVSRLVIVCACGSTSLLSALVVIRPGRMDAVQGYLT